MVSRYTPTRLYIDAIWPPAAGHGWQVQAWLGLLDHAALGGILVVWGYRRDEGQSYRWAASTCLSMIPRPLAADAGERHG